MTSLEELNVDFDAASIEIREVWESNLEVEFSRIRLIVSFYPFVGMDTEFPGIVLHPAGPFQSITDLNYRTLKANVDHLKLIQVGLTFSNSFGHLPRCGHHRRPCIWQFNFRDFDTSSDAFVPESIELLRHSGIDFDKNRRLGIAAPRFAELLISSGVVFSKSVRWITFHGCYDFGYLLKILTCQNLPETQEEFFAYLQLYFPKIYDVKHLIKFCNNLYGGLNKLAELLEVKRVGICHQAGSDSLLTVATFKKLKDNYFNGSTEKYAGVLYGLGDN